MLSLDADGKTEAVLPKPGMYYSPRFSPDGRRLAFAIEAGNGSDIFVYDFASQSTTRLSFSQQGNIEPVWTPGGKHIVYRSIRSPALRWVRADGVGEPQRLHSSSVSGHSSILVLAGWNAPGLPGRKHSVEWFGH